MAADGFVSSAARATDPTTIRRPAKPVAALVEGYSIEATPKQIEEAPSLGTDLPSETEVYVPLLPRADIADTVAACRTLSDVGLRSVPHIAARRLRSRAELDCALGNLVEAGAHRLLLIAGDVPEAAGPFAATMDLLDTGLLQAHGVRRIGFAGHPEGHPAAGTDDLLEALRRKAAYARETGSDVHLVTQFAFAAEPIIGWLDSLRPNGVDLPVRVGVAGPARLKTLLSYALHCGIGPSSRLLARRRDTTRLLGGWTPTDLVADLGRYRSGVPNTPLCGLHVFPFGGLAMSIEWLGDLAGPREPADPADVSQLQSLKKARQAARQRQS